MTLLFNNLSVEFGFVREIGKLNRKEASEMAQQGEPCACKPMMRERERERAACNPRI